MGTRFVGEATAVGFSIDSSPFAASTTDEPAAEAEPAAELRSLSVSGLLNPAYRGFCKDAISKPIDETHITHGKHIVTDKIEGSRVSLKLSSTPTSSDYVYDSAQYG